MIRRGTWAAAVACAALFAAAGCGGASSDSGGGGGGGGAKADAGFKVPKVPMAQSVGAGEGKLNIIAWAGYAEDGSTDPKVDWVTPFEKKTGCQVNVKIGNTSDEMVTLMRTGQYDGVSASGDATLRLIAGGDVAPVNTKLVPNYADVFQQLKNQEFNSVNGQMYGIPHGRGANLLMWRSDKVPGTLDSWSAVFDQGSQYKGSLTAYDNPIYIADAALYLMKKKPELGIADPYELTEPQYAAALAVLRDQKKLTHRYWHDATVQMSDFKNEGVVASSSWGYMVNGLVGDNQPVASTVPAEGSTGWADTTMLHADARHPGCAYRWMEWSLNPELQIALAEWFGSVPVVPAACKARPPHGSDACAVNGFDRFAQVHFWRTPTGTCTQGACVPYSKWVTDYVAIMGGG
jgi:putative spermidine/putrescine transport system substrate-binding protein